MNNVSLSGRIATDLVLKYTEANIPTISFNLAVRQEFKTNGEYLTDFIRCVCWREQAENLYKFKRKGAWIEVYGSISTRDYETQDGRKYITEVQTRKINYPAIGEKHEEQREPNPQKNQKTPQIDVNEDDLPF